VGFFYALEMTVASFFSITKGVYFISALFGLTAIGSIESFPVSTVGSDTIVELTAYLYSLFYLLKAGSTD
jgi:hypothetical protein